MGLSCKGWFEIFFLESSYIGELLDQLLLICEVFVFSWNLTKKLKV